MTKKPKTTIASLSQSKIERLPNGNIEILITIPWQTISDEYEKSLKSMAKFVKIKGFRPGKAPAKMTEKKLTKEKIYQEMIKTLTTDVYLEAIKTHKLLPIVNPKITLVSSEENKDWQIKAVTAEIPKFDLGDYKEGVKKELAPSKIWTPGKGKKTEKETTKSKDQKLQQVFDILLKIIPIKLPELLVENEVNRMLSRLIDQTARLGLTIEQYLVSIGKNSKQLKEDYQKQAENSIKLELVLSAIANRENIKIPEAEVEKMIQVNPDEKTRKSLEAPAQKTYIRQILRKRKAIDILSRL